MAIQAFGPDGKEVEPGVEGELVCTKPFPCQPLGFWPLDGMGAPRELVNEASTRHRVAYFGVWPGVWCEWTSSVVFVVIGQDCLGLVNVFLGCHLSPLPGWTDCQGTVELTEPAWTDHGDHIIISKSREHSGGGVVMLGRSDGVL